MRRTVAAAADAAVHRVWRLTGTAITSGFPAGACGVVVLFGVLAFAVSGGRLPGTAKGLPTRFTMQPKWIALGLFVAGLASLLIGAGLPYLKHLAIGLTSVLA